VSSSCDSVDPAHLRTEQVSGRQLRLVLAAQPYADVRQASSNAAHRGPGSQHIWPGGIRSSAFSELGQVGFGWSKRTVSGSGFADGGWHAEVGGSAGAAVDLGKLVVGAGEADFEAFGFAEPAFAFGFCDAGGEVVADVGDAGPLGGVWPVHGAAQAGLTEMILLPFVRAYLDRRSRSVSKGFFGCWDLRACRRSWYGSRRPAQCGVLPAYLIARSITGRYAAAWAGVHPAGPSAASSVAIR
jgi:hypothetical protein